ncbi:alpha-1-acid glycoprotein-like [Molossus nigricans]
MALPWALAIFSLLPLLDARSPACTDVTVPVTNATLSQISGKWFYIASGYRYPEFKEMASKIEAAFFYFALNYTDDTLLLREYLTSEGKCIYNESSLSLSRENGTLSKLENGTEHTVYLMLPKDPTIFMLAFRPGDKENSGLSFYADKPQVTPEQMEQFYEDLACLGMDKSEVMYTEEKKDLCEPLEKLHDEERKKESETPH